MLYLVSMLFSTLTTVALVLLLYVSVLFICSVIFKRNDVADIGWGIGILIVALVSYSEQLTPTLTSKILVLLVGVWAVRLSVRIFIRNRKKGEDERYKTWREMWGNMFYVRSFFQVYLLQGALMMLVGYAVIHATVYGLTEIHTLWLLVGVSVWLFGFLFEVISDYQLDAFLKREENKGQLMTQGLWKYSRHPNYFGEVVLWWGIWCIVLPLPFGFIAVVSPLTITYLILKVSGIPMVEKHMSHYIEFQSYKERTSAFIPLPPKKHDFVSSKGQYE